MHKNMVNEKQSVENFRDLPKTFYNTNLTWQLLGDPELSTLDVCLALETF
jgi:hypothetical protein